MNIGLSEVDVRRYSVMNLIRSLCFPEEWRSAASFERECSNAVEKKLGQLASHGGVLVPSEALHRRDLVAASGSAGGYLVSTSTKPLNFVAAVRNASRTLEAGVTVLEGLTGNVTLLREATGTTITWIPIEGAQVSDQTPTFGQVALSPKNASAVVKMSRTLAVQTGAAAETVVWRELGAAAGEGIDAAVIQGSGASGQPLGLLNTSGMGSVSGTTLGDAGLRELQTDVATAKCLTGNFSYLTTTAVGDLLMSRQRFSSTDTPIWEGSLYTGMVRGCPARSSNNVPAATMIGGDFSEAVVGQWGALELAADPYTFFKSGVRQLRLSLTIDVGIRKAAAFSVATSIT